MTAASPPARPLARFVRLLVLATVVVGAALATGAPAYAAAPAAMEADFVARTNAARAAAGLPGYAVAADLVSVARQQSARMAARGTIYHNPNLTTDVAGWQAVGENVGEGPSVADLSSAFLASPSHRANLLDRSFTQVGIGVVVDANGIVWVTQVFRQPLAAAPAPAPVTVPAPTTAPAPNHATAPAPTPAHATAAGAPQPPAAAAPTVNAAAGPVAGAPTRTVPPTAAALAHARIARQLAAARARAKQTRADPVARAVAYAALLRDLTGYSAG